MIARHENATHELVESMAADWPEAQPFMLAAGPLQVGALTRDDLEQMFQEGRYRLYLARRKSDSQLVATVLVQLSSCPEGLLGILHFLDADSDFPAYALEFVQKIQELLAQEPLFCQKFLGMARSPFHELFLQADRFSPGGYEVTFGYQWTDPLSA